MGLERFSHVMHLTSIVEGRLADDRDRFDALVSCFPAGTVSGAPKVRAMQIIKDLEPSGRGLTPVPLAIWISRGISISASRFGPSSCRGEGVCRPVPAS
jgi:hypothetical protein